MYHVSIRAFFRVGSGLILSLFTFNSIGYRSFDNFQFFFKIIGTKYLDIDGS